MAAGSVLLSSMPPITEEKILRDIREQQRASLLQYAEALTAYSQSPGTIPGLPVPPGLEPALVNFANQPITAYIVAYGVIVHSIQKVVPAPILTQVKVFVGL